MKEYVFKKNLLFRFSAYLLLIPFIPAIRPLLNSHTTEDLVIFICGILLSLFLILYSNRRPYVKINEQNLFVYLMYRHKPEIHYLSSIEKITLRSARKLTLYTDGFNPLDLRLGKKELIKLTELLQAENITVNTVYRNS